MTFPLWAPPPLVRFYKDHQDADTVNEKDLHVLGEMLEHPDMEIFWLEFSQRFPGREWDLYCAVTQALSRDLQTISDRMKDAHELEQKFIDLERTLRRVLPDARARDGRPLLEHLEWVRRLKVKCDEKSLRYFCALPNCITKHSRLRLLIADIDQEFHRGLGYRMLSRLGAVIFGCDEIEPTTVRDTINQIRRLRDSDLDNPLTQVMERLIEQTRSEGKK